MWWKLLCLFMLSFISSSETSPVRGNEANASQAFSDLAILGNQILNLINYNGDILYKNMSIQLELQEQSIIEVATGKVQNIRGKISQILINMDKAEIEDVCFLNDSYQHLDDFITKIKERVKNCTIYTEKIIRSFINETIVAIQVFFDDIMSCHGRSLSECSFYNVNDSCYDFVTSKIEEAQYMLINGVNLRYISLNNQIISLKLPCRDLINAEISVYPDLVLNLFNECAYSNLLNWPTAC